MTVGESSKYPNLIIGGAPKCGTSSLFFWLGAHPEVCASRVKETYFLADQVNRFNKDLNIHDHGLEAYQQFFSHCKGEKYRVEATPVYIYYEKTRQFLKQLPQMPKVIFILRKPEDRLYSHWRFNRYRMKNINLSFEEYTDFKNAPKGWANYLEQTHYINYILRYVETCGKENILVYQFEQMRKDKQGFMKALASDLDIDPGFYNGYDFFHRNETVTVKNKKLHRLGLKLEPFVPQWVQEKIIPVYLKFNAKATPSITDKEKRLKHHIGERYAESNALLAEYFPNIDLDLW